MQLARLADTLNELRTQIPEDIDWVLRVDGHTDSVPIKTPKFASNWELSSARSISVVKYLIDHGVPANHSALDVSANRGYIGCKSLTVALGLNEKNNKECLPSF